MKIGLIDVDGHHYPNLALMKLSAYHKAQGDAVDWWWGWDSYDLVYMSKVFSDTYTPDHPTPVNADRVIRGGSGYAIHTAGGLELYERDLDPPLPAEVARMMPDYSLYPTMTRNTAYGRLTEGCPKKCPWCHVCAMQGCVARQVAELGEFWNGQRDIVIMDPNILASPEREKLLLELAGTGARVNINQGLDIQRMDDAVDLINRVNMKTLYFAWDDPEVDLTDQFSRVGNLLRIKDHRRRNVYVLANFGGSTLEDALWRVYTLRGLGFDPYVMVYDKPNAPADLLRLQGWCNNKIIFGAEPDFEKYGR